MKLTRPAKRTIITGALSAAILLGAGLYTWQSLAAWKGYEARLQSEQAAYARLQDAALKGETPGQRLVAIRALDDKVSRRDELCRMNGLFAWQALIVPPLRDGLERCRQAVKRLGTVAGPLHALRQYLDGAEKLRSTIGTLGLTETLNESNWSEKGLARAKRLQKDVAALQISGDAGELKQRSEGLSDALVNAWEGLIKADAAKDQTAFISAAASVTKAYADFAVLADLADESIQDKADALLKVATKP